MSEKTYGLFAKNTNKKLIENLSGQNAKLVLFPAPEISQISANSEILQNLFEFEWIIFTDVFSVEYFLQKAESGEIDLFELDSLRICTVGEAAADRLRFVQVHSDVIPAKSFPADVFAALSEYIFEDEELKRLKFLIVCPKNSEVEIFEILRRNEINVTAMPVYQISFSESENLPKLKALFAGGAIDEFLFSAPEDVLFLKNLLGIEDFSEIMIDIKLTATDAVTAQTLSEFSR